MKRIIKLPVFILCLTIFAVMPINSAFAAGTATNTAADGLGAFTLLPPAVDITVIALDSRLVKTAFNTTTSACLATSDTDALCAAGVDTTTVPSGTALTFMVYVDNATALDWTDIRFNDVLDVTGTGFSYVGGTIRYGTPVTGSTKAAILAATTNGVSDALDGNLANEYAGHVGGTVSAGGTSLAGSNTQVDVTAGTIFSIAFDVTKN